VSSYCWNIWGRDASSTLGRNDSDMKGQSHRASGGKFTVGSAQKIYMYEYFILQVRYAFVYGFTVTPGLVLLRGTCPTLACNSILTTRFGPTRLVATLDAGQTM